ncbi:response regulator [Serratia rhizosphaerae]|uniref:response regulator n=1 Tax=unclassified Serratia (in: enterobacteria) TaxID=2647522 RepID=UPI000CF63F4F|nr:MULTISPECIES: response regulator transcription factor [unclassified Serratia (in: enterobacteria)]MBU3893343.1 response regulator transcription factor [Serratia rubidaea]AVJ19295.1 DNA-binding response regulator [Serratia sp. MYb239]MCA4825433.1 response regulator transcription factor [Serratia rubidaea]QNK33096.1 response regulator transcription factor [Serratia sp. JUb9]QPT13382.1 response regulator transcription factor [Serratia rubidaea]
MTQPIRLMIAEDHAIMREGLKQLFLLDAGIKVVAEAADGGRVLERLRAGDVDLLLLDISMPGISGEDLINRISSQHPGLKILVLSMFNEPQIAQRMLEHGALGYITKDRNPEALLNAIRSVASGARYIDHELAQKIVFAQYQSNSAPHENLTLRERQIMIMLAHGESINAIADTLAISNKTVSTYKSRLMKKMGFTANADIVKYAISYNLVQ